MTSDEHTDTILRLRGELAELHTDVRPGQIEEVIEHCHSRHQAKRRQRLRLAGVAGAVVVAAIGAFALTGRTPGDADRVTAAATVSQWPARGALVRDETLLARAERAWRDSGISAPVGPVHPLYADRSPGNSIANLVVVVLSASNADGEETVAFVTSPTTPGQPNSGRLFLRAVDEVGPGQPAIGFVATRPAPQDDDVAGGASIGFVLAAPSVQGVELRSSVVDQTYSDRTTPPADATWQILPTSVGAWNSTITVPKATGKPILVRPAAGIQDPPTRPITLHSNSSGQYASDADGRPAAKGDLIFTGDGIVGMVDGPDGEIDTDLTRLADYGDLKIAISNIPGTLIHRANGVIAFQPGGPGEVASGNRVVLTSHEIPGLVVNVGHLSKTDAGWQLIRAVNPHTTAPMMALSAGPNPG